MTDTPPLPTWFKPLSQALIGTFALVGVLSLARAWNSHRLVKYVEQAATAPRSIDPADGVAIDAVGGLLNLAAAGSYVLLAAGFVLWAYRGHKSDSVRAEMPHWWLIGGWFIPFLNLFLPFLAVHDTYRGTFRRRGQASRDIGGLIFAWWAGLLLTNLSSVWAAGKRGALLRIDYHDSGWFDAALESARADELSQVIGAFAVLPAIVLVIVVTRSLLAPLDLRLT